MEVMLQFALPREPASVYVVRRTLKHALLAMQVPADVVSDVELALAEAVTSVLNHPDSSENYHVMAHIDPDVCVIDVVDRSFGHGSVPAAPPEELEAGRGLLLMRAVSDRVTVPRRDASGMTVRIEKRLT